MHVIKRFVVLVAILACLISINYSSNVNANEFEDVKEIPFTLPLNP